MTASADSPVRAATVESSSGIAPSAGVAVQAASEFKLASGQNRQPGTSPMADTGLGPRSVARLGMVVGSQRLLVELAEAGEIVAMPPVIVPVPLTRDWLLGVTNVRGALFTVVDLRRFAGDGVTEVTKETRLLSLAPSLGFNVTLVVSKMLGLRNTASMTAVVNALPAHAGANWLGNSFADADGHIWRELSLSRLIATPDFLMVGR